MKDEEGICCERFRDKKVSLRNAILIGILSILLVSYIEYVAIHHSNENKSQAIIQQNNRPPESVTRFRMNNYQFAHPLLLIDIGDESEDLSSLKNEISQLIELKKSSGEITSASVFVKRMNDGHYFSINGSEGYG